jgi:hypothetical protein
VALVIVSKFLLAVIGSLGPLLFQVHLKSTWQFFLLGAITCVPFFERLVEKIVGRLQESVSTRLHNHSLINILCDLSFDSHWTYLKSCARLGADVWLLTHLVIFFSTCP